MSQQPNPRREAFQAWMRAKGVNPSVVSKRSGVPYTTLASFIQGGTRSLKGTSESKIAEAFGSTIDELFVSGGRAMPVVGHVGAATEFHGYDDHEKGAGLDEIDMPPGTPPNAVAVIVRGDSGYPSLRDGMILIYWDCRADPTPDMIGQDCFVRLRDGRTLVKILERGSAPNLWTLVSMNAAVPPIRDVEIEWAAPIEIRLRRKNWRGEYGVT